MKYNVKLDDNIIGTIKLTNPLDFDELCKKLFSGDITDSDFDIEWEGTTKFYKSKITQEKGNIQVELELHRDESGNLTIELEPVDD